MELDNRPSLADMENKFRRTKLVACIGSTVLTLVMIPVWPLITLADGVMDLHAFRRWVRPSQLFFTLFRQFNRQFYIIVIFCIISVTYRPVVRPVCFLCQGGVMRSCGMSVIRSFCLSVCRITAKVIGRFYRTLCHDWAYESEELINFLWWCCSGYGFRIIFPLPSTWQNNGVQEYGLVPVFTKSPASWVG